MQIIGGFLSFFFPPLTSLVNTPIHDLLLFFLFSLFILWQPILEKFKANPLYLHLGLLQQGEGRRGGEVDCQ